MRIWPFDCTTMACTGPLTVTLNVGSSEPLALSLAKKFWVAPPMLRKVPPTSIWPFESTDVANTVPVSSGFDLQTPRRGALAALLATCSRFTPPSLSKEDLPWICRTTLRKDSTGTFIRGSVLPRAPVSTETGEWSYQESR